MPILCKMSRSLGILILIFNDETFKLSKENELYLLQNLNLVLPIDQHLYLKNSLKIFLQKFFKRRHDTQHYDNQHNDTQHNNIQHNKK